MEVIIATTTWYNDVNEVRAQLALKTAEEAKKYKLPLVVVDEQSPKSFRQALTERGKVLIFRQGERGLGVSRRRVLSIASDFAGSKGLVVWMEAEKHSLISKLPAVISLMEAEGIDLATLGRKNKDNYPDIQKAAETFANLASQTLTGLAWDFNFGPFIANQISLQHFLDYKGEYGDRWEGLNIPRIRALAAGLNVKCVDVDYIHPPEQAAETGPAFVMKRLEQLTNQIQSFNQEAKKLGFPK